MEISIEQQIFDLVKKSNKILVVLPENLSADALGSGLALRRFLLKLEKDVSIVSGGPAPDFLKFLPEVGSLTSEIGAVKSLVVAVNTSQKKIAEISYQTKADKVEIYLKSEGEVFTPEDLNFRTEKFPVDLIITLEAKSLADLGRVYDKQPDVFFETPKINIDHQAGNEYFGSINLVDLAASSVAEMLAELFQKFEQQLIDEDSATCLLAGIIFKTQSFQHAKTTPRAFLKASELVAFGGRQQEVIKNLYRTKSLSLLKLWGRALARMKVNEALGFVYSVLNSGDFEKAESGEADILPALRELNESVSGSRLVGLIVEPIMGQAELWIAAQEALPKDKILKLLGQSAEVVGHQANNYWVARLKPSGVSLEELESRLVEIAENILR